MRLPEVAESRTILASFAFITVGVSLKLALWPLHVWLPNAYAFAPSAVSAFISATSTKVMVYVLLRFAFTVFGVDFAFGTLGLGLPLMVLALSGVWVASGVAIFQTNLKRLLAYSSVAQIGYMILGISLATPLGVAAGLLHLFNHALMKGALFLAVGTMALRTGGKVGLEDLRGVGQVMPLTTAAFVVGGLGLIGVPLTVGFTSKWVLLDALFQAGFGWTVPLVLLPSLLALAYVWRGVEAAWFEAPSEALQGQAEAPWYVLAPLWLMVLGTLVFGVQGAWTTDIAVRAATLLVGEVP